MDAARRIKWTEEEYLARERKSAGKNEFLEGEVYAMVGARLRHNVIAANIVAGLHSLVRDRPCSAFTSDQRIHVRSTGLYTYPDAGVVCGKPQFHPLDDMVLLNPLVLVEVLSGSTERYDRGEKLGHYRTLSSLYEVLLVAQKERWVEHHRRVEPDKDQWLVTIAREGVVTMPALGGGLALDDVYEKVELGDDAG